MLTRNSEMLVLGQESFETVSVANNWKLEWEKVPSMHPSAEGIAAWDNYLGVEPEYEVYSIHGYGSANYLALIYSSCSGVIKLKFRDPECSDHIVVPMKMCAGIDEFWCEEISAAHDPVTGTMAYHIRISMGLTGVKVVFDRYVIFRNIE